MILVTLSTLFLKSSPKDFLSLLFERGEGREREGEKHQCERETLIGCLLMHSLTRDRTCNLGPWDILQPTESHGPGHCPHFSLIKILLWLFSFFTEMEKGGRKEGRETLNGCLSHMPEPGMGPTTQAYVLIGNRIGIEPATFCFAGNTQPTEPHQSGLPNFLKVFSKRSNECALPFLLRSACLILHHDVTPTHSPCLSCGLSLLHPFSLIQ